MQLAEHIASNPVHAIYTWLQRTHTRSDVLLSSHCAAGCSLRQQKSGADGARMLQGVQRLQRAHRQQAVSFSHPSVAPIVLRHRTKQPLVPFLYQTSQRWPSSQQRSPLYVAQGQQNPSDIKLAQQGGDGLSASGDASTPSTSAASSNGSSSSNASTSGSNQGWNGSQITYDSQGAGALKLPAGHTSSITSSEPPDEDSKGLPHRWRVVLMIAVRVHAALAGTHACACPVKFLPHALCSCSLVDLLSIRAAQLLWHPYCAAVHAHKLGLLFCFLPTTHAMTHTLCRLRLFCATWTR